MSDFLAGLRELLTQEDGNPMMPGQVEAGNIPDIGHRPSVPNPEGGHSTVWSQGGAGKDGLEVVHPRVVNGKILSPDEAWDHYKRTGEHLGKFTSVAAADKYGEMLHQQQAMSPAIKALLMGMKF